MSVLIITGFFFQNQRGLGLGVGNNGEGVVAVVRSGLVRTIFSGVLYEDPEHVLHALAGVMTDKYGDSTLSDGRFLSEDTLEFTKRYDQRDSEIRYSFKREGTFWVGEFSGEKAGSGKANCTIIEVPEEFFLPAK